MAHLMLNIGDMQITVNRLPEAVDYNKVNGDHVVRFYDISGGPALGGAQMPTGEVAEAIMGEADALEVVGAWLTLETKLESPESRAVLIEMFPEACVGENAWLLP